MLFCISQNGLHQCCPAARWLIQSGPQLALRLLKNILKLLQRIFFCIVIFELCAKLFKIMFSTSEMFSHLYQILPELDLQMWGPVTNVEMWGPCPYFFSLSLSAV